MRIYNHFRLRKGDGRIYRRSAVMKDFSYLIENFFTHKDFLAPADQMPGTLFTPLHAVFSAVVLAIVVLSAIYVAKHPKKIRPVFTAIWITLVVLEVVVVTWESLSGKQHGLDLTTNLSLYPCSIFMYAMPFAIWGKGILRQMSCGYVCTLGLLGAAVNFFYPAIRLSVYSCISFAGFHTFLYHGSMLFTCLVMLISGYHRYTGIHRWWEMLLPCVPTLAVSIPANIINFSPIRADYMFFRGKFPLLASIFDDTHEVVITLVLYALYIVIPALFYLPSFLSQRKKAARRQEEKEEPTPVYPH